MVRAVATQVESQENRSSAGIFEDDDEEAVDSVDKEVDDYLRSPATPNMSGSIADYWKAQEALGLYPNLRKVVASLLALPASTAEAERSFSKLKHLVPVHRIGLLEDSIKSSLLCRSLLPLVNKF